MTRTRRARGTAGPPARPPAAGRHRANTHASGTSTPSTHGPSTHAPGTSTPGTSTPGTPAPGTSAPSTYARGRAAEEEAVRWLETQGYQVLERNVVNHAGEIDLVARDAAGVLCFVEVKARTSSGFGLAIAAVGPAKRRRLSRAAALHLAIRGLYLSPCRFDVLGLDWIGTGWRFTLVRDAFPFSP
jgi:putative endonuclease